MGVNRFEKYSNVNLASNYWAPQEMPTINMELWGKVLENQQKQYDTLSQTKGMMPKYYHGDREQAASWMKEHQDAADKATSIYASGNQNAVQLGNKALQEYSSKLRQDIATGTFAQLGDRKTQYDKIEEEYNKRDKDTPTFFQQFRKDQFHKSIPTDISKPILDPGIGKYEDIKDYLNKAKAIMDSDKIGTFDLGNGTYITKETIEKVPQERRDVVFNGIMHDPKFAATQQAAVWDRTRNIDPNVYVANHNEAIQQGVTEIDKSKESISSMLKSKKPEDIKEAQKALRAAGLDIQVDGDAGVKTKEALKRYNEMADSKKAELAGQVKSQISQEEIAMNEAKKYVKENEDYFNGLFGVKKDRDVTVNPLELARRKAASQQKMLETTLTKIGEAFIQPAQSGLMTPHGVMDETRTFENAKVEAENGIRQADQGLKIGRDALAKQLGLQNIEPAVYEQMLIAHNKASANGKFDNAVYQREIAKNGDWMAKTVGGLGAKLEEHLTVNGFDASATFLNGKNKAMATKQFVDNAWNNASERLNELGKGADAVIDKYYNMPKFKGKFATKEEFKKALMSNQGNVNSDSLFYEKRRSGADGDEVKGNTKRYSEHNLAKEAMNEIAQATGKKVQDLTSPTIQTSGYTQIDDKMPLGDLSKQIIGSVVSGNLKGYGVGGNKAVWRDREGKVVEVKGDEDIKNATVQFIPDPINGAKYFITSVIDGKKVEMMSDIPNQHKAIYSKNAAAEALLLKNTNVGVSKLLMNSSNLVENGGSAIPNYSHINKENVNAKQQYIKTSTGNTMNLILSNDFVADDVVVVGNQRLGVKAINDGKNQKFVVVTQYKDKNGNDAEGIVKLKNGEMNTGKEYYFNDPQSAQEELHLFTKNSRPDVMRTVEESKQRRKVSSSSSSQSQTATGVAVGIINQ